MIEQILKDYEKAKRERLNYDPIFEIITRYIVPFRGDFTSIGKDTGTNYQVSNAGIDNVDEPSIQYTSDAAIALNELVATITNRLTDPTQKWIALKPKNKTLVNNERVKSFLARVEDLVFEVFSSSESGFLQSNHEAIHDAVSYGTAALMVLEGDEDDISFKSLTLSNFFIEENYKGEIDTVYIREFLNPRQAVQKYGESALSEEILRQYKEGSQLKIEFVNVITPRKYFESLNGKVSGVPSKFDYLSIHFCVQDRRIVKQKGFQGNPIIAFRFDKLAGEVYGIAPSFKILTDVRILNEAQKEFLWATHMLGAPPILTQEELPENQIDLSPNGTVQGGINDEGDAVIKPFNITPDLNSLLVLMDKLALNIRRAYLNDTLRDSKGKQPLTATESIHLDEKEKTLLAPQIRRLESEYLNKLVKRVILLLQRQKKLPEIPAELKGKIDVVVEYVSPLSFTLQSNQAAAFNRFFANAASLLQIDPSGLVNLKTDDAIRYLAEKSGIPLIMIQETKVVEEIRAAQAESARQQQEIANLQAGAAATADLSKAGVNPLGQ